MYIMCGYTHTSFQFMTSFLPHSYLDCDILSYAMEIACATKEKARSNRISSILKQPESMCKV